MRHTILAAGFIGIVAAAAPHTANAQTKGLTVDGDGNVTITGDLHVSGAIYGPSLRTTGDAVIGGDIEATGDITGADIKAKGYLSKDFSGTYWRLDYGELHRNAAYWYRGASPSVASASPRSTGAPEALGGALEAVQAMTGVSYPMTQPGGGAATRDYGVLPSGAGGTPDTLIDDRQALAVLVEAVKQQQKQIKVLRTELNALAARLGRAGEAAR